MRPDSFFVLKWFATGELAAYIEPEAPHMQEAERQVPEGQSGRGFSTGSVLSPPRLA